MRRQAGKHNWMPVGPSTLARGIGYTNRPALSGRVTALEAGPSNASGARRVYAGTAGGGVWRSDDSGLTWTPLLDEVSSNLTRPGGNVMSIGALAVHFGATAADDVVYVGTGESNLGTPTMIVYDQVPGAGILRSGSPTGAGWTLEATNLLAGERVAGLLLDPADPDHVLAATTAGLFHRQAGSWSPVTGLPGGYASGVAMSMAGGAPTYYVAIVNVGVYSSVSLDSGWTLLAGIPPAPGRLVVGACDSDPTGVYALREDGTLWKLTGTAFQQVGGVPDALVPGNPNNDEMNWYHLVVTVHPSDPRTVYLGHEVVYVAAVAGSPPLITPSPPFFRNLWADVHAVAFARLPNGARDATELWIGDDGGVYRTNAPTNTSSAEPKMIGRATNQPYALSLRADTDAVALIGMQDTGIGRWLGEPAWVRPQRNGDCFAVAIDPAKPWRMMAAMNGFAPSISLLYTSNDNGLSFSPVTTFPVSERSGQPFDVLDAVASAGGSLLFFGTTRLWVSEDWGVTWSSIPDDTGSDNIDGDPIVALSVVSDLLVFAATQHNIQRYERNDPGSPWTSTKIENPPGTDANYWISGLAGGPSEAFFLTYSSRPANGTIGWAHFNNGIGTSAASWQEALPLSVVDRPAHAVVTDPSNHSVAYVGTDVGVWKLTYEPGAGFTAEPFSFGLPETAVFDLAFHPRSRVLYAATHGRGVWEVDPDGTENATDPNLYLRLSYADNGRLAAPRKRQPYLDDGLPDPSLPAGTRGALYSWMSPDIKIRRPSHDQTPLDLIDYVDFTTRVDDVVDAALDIETADIGPNSIYVQVHNRSMTPLPSDQVHVLTLVTDASLVLEPLPSDWAKHINALESGDWPGSGWHYADPGRPYHLPVQSTSGPPQGPLDARTPLIYEFDVDFSQLNLPAGHDHACVAAFVTAPGVTPFGAIPTDLPPDVFYVSHSDTHVAYRNVHLVATHLAGRRQSGARDTRGLGHMVNVIARNPYNRPIDTDLVIRSAAVNLPLAVVLPRLDLEERALEGLRPATPEDLDEALAYAHRSWFAELDELVRNGPSPPQRARVERLRRLDPQRVLHTVGPGDARAVRRIPLDPGSAMPVGLLLRVPDYAQPGEKYRVHVMQTHEGRVLGGSTYVLATYA